MQNLEKAIERIKVLECATGDLEYRVEEILENYKVANKNDIAVKRNEQFDNDGLEAYSAKILTDENQDIIVLAKSGLDDYVTTVVDAYIH